MQSRVQARGALRHSVHALGRMRKEYERVWLVGNRRHPLDAIYEHGLAVEVKQTFPSSEAPKLQVAARRFVARHTQIKKACIQRDRPVQMRDRKLRGHSRWTVIDELNVQSDIRGRLPGTHTSLQFVQVSAESQFEMRVGLANDRSKQRNDFA